MLGSLRHHVSGLAALCVLGLVLGIASPHFFTVDNILNVVQQSSINALLGVGLTFVIISGGIDLSVGSVLALSGLVGALLCVHGSPLYVALLAMLGVGTLCGWMNGWVITKTGIPPFIATLGMMLVARSVAVVISGGQPVSALPASLRWFAGNRAGVPMLAWWVLGLYVLAHAVFTRTLLGRYTYAIGGNEKAAWLSGVPVQTYKTVCYTLSGFCAALAALFLTARLDAATPLAGEMAELYAIAAAVLGGVSLLGGEGSVWGTLTGALLMGSLRNGLNLLNVPPAWEGVVIGSVLVVAVVADRVRHRSSSLTEKYRMGIRIGWVVLVCVLLAGAFWVRKHHRSVAQQHVWTVAFIPKAIGSPFWQAMQEGALKEAQRLGVRVITAAPDRETAIEQQFQIIENMVERKVDALLLAPCGSKELLQAVKKANEANIPVLLVDSDIDREAAKKAGVSVVSYIGSDNQKGGFIAGQSLAEHMGFAGDVVVLEGPLGHETAQARRKGFMEALKQHPGMRVVASQTAHSERDRGYSVTHNLLQSHPQVKGLFATNDEMALGALEALKSTGQEKRVAVVGFDAIDDAVKHIQQGTMLGSVAQFPSEMGKWGVFYAIQTVKNKKLPPPVVHTKVEFIRQNNVEQKP
jgi:ribose/xylose/arabinose/galactoside ABC-type transport system permease subunit/ABC-type sugar transport system substrate-binding protein